MKEFDKWLCCVIDNMGNEWPAFSRFDTISEDNAAEGAWQAALEWILYAGVLTDLPKDLIEKELDITK